MSECKREDMSERILMALHPEDFGAQAEAVRAHAKECRSCMDELNCLTELTAFLRQHKAELASAIDPCPSADSLVEFAVGERVDPSIESHLHYCSDCAEQVEQVRSLSAEDLPVAEALPGIKEKSFINSAVAGAYPGGPAKGGTIWNRALDFFRNAFHVPSMAMGAAVSVAIAAILWVHPTGTDTLRPMLSEVTWRVGPVQVPGNGLVPKKAAIPTAKVGILFLASGKDAPSQRNMDELYARVNIAEKNYSKFQFFSPRDMKRSLGNVSVAKDPGSLAGQVFAKMEADYVLTFTVSGSKAGLSLEGSLFKRGRQSAVASLTQTGIAPERLPSRITALGTDLLDEGLAVDQLSRKSSRTYGQRDRV